MFQVDWAYQCCAAEALEVWVSGVGLRPVMPDAAFEPETLAVVLESPELKALLVLGFRV